MTSACGLCGKDSIDAVRARSAYPVEQDPVAVEPAWLAKLPDRMRQAQAMFERTGGIHAAALVDVGRDEVLVVREDIGRHNAVDKVVGARLLAGEHTAAPVLCVSGRIGFEIVQKAAAAGVGVLAAIGAPSSLAARLAEDAGVCLVGFLSAERYVAYTAVHRIGVG